MTTPVNDRDLILAGGGTRTQSSASTALFVVADATNFYKHVDGSHAPDVVHVTAKLLLADGPITFSPQGCTLSNVTGTTCEVAFASVTGTLAVVTATAANNGNPISQSVILGVVSDGAVGKSSWTWVKYADSAAGAGLSDDPTGKTYIGLAYNKPTATESTDPSLYAWSLIKGADGQSIKGDPGKDGTTYYTWIKYSNSADGSGLYDAPSDATMYIGLAVNKTVPAESTNPADYTWSKFRGSDGVSIKGDPGVRGAGQYYSTGSAWSDSAAQMATPGGTAILGDVVTISNGSSYALTKRWDGDSWEVLGAVYDGSLFVTGSINGAALKVGTVEIRDSQGRLILGAGDFDGSAGGVKGAVTSAAGTASWNNVGGRPDDPSNLVVKSIFEDGQLNGWTDSNGVPLAIVPVTNQSFTKAVQFAMRDNWDATHAFPVVPGETLYVEAWVDASTCNAPVSIGVSTINSAGSNVGFPSISSLPAGTGWTRITGKITIPTTGGSVLGRPWVTIATFSNFGTARATLLRISRFQSGATAGATLGVNVGGAITDTNAPGLVQISNLRVLGTAIGNFSTPGVGGRTDMGDYGVRVYDQVNAPRCLMGNLSV